MRYRTALLKYVPHAFYYQILGGETMSGEIPSVQQAKNTLIELLEMDGFKREDLMEFDAPNLLEMAYKELFVNYDCDRCDKILK